MDEEVIASGGGVTTTTLTPSKETMALTTALSPQDVEALQLRVQALEHSNAALQQQLQAQEDDFAEAHGPAAGSARTSEPTDTLSVESQEAVVSSDASDAGDPLDSDGGSGGGGGRGSEDGDALDAQVLPVPVRRESRTISAEAFPTQAKSIAKSVKPRASFRLLIDVHSGHYVWWEFATAHRDIGFGVDFYYPSPEVKYNTPDALFEGILTQVGSLLVWCNACQLPVRSSIHPSIHPIARYW